MNHDKQDSSKLKELSDESVYATSPDIFNH